MDSLQKWVVEYEKYKDSVNDHIESYDVKEDKIIFNTGEGVIVVRYEESLGDIEGFDYDKVVCLNTRDNLDWLIDNWEDIKGSETMFLFVNLEEKESWGVKPTIHDRITEDSNLENSLEGLFESVSES